MKRNLLKAIGISFLLFVVLSWIIPTGTYTSGKLAKSGIDAVGLFDLVGVPVQTILTFALYALVFACIGGLYGVMSKTGALEIWTRKIAKHFEGKEKRFLVFSVLFFVVLSSLTGLVLPLFVLVPLFAIVIFELKFDKFTTLAATVGAILVGSIASTYGFNISGYTKNILSLNMNSEIVAKLIILVLLTGLLIIYVLKLSIRKNNKKEEKIVKEEAKKEPIKKIEKKSPTKKTNTKKPASKNIKKTTKKNTKNLALTSNIKKVKAEKTVSIVPLVIIYVLMMLIILVGMYNWYYSFNIGIFNNMHESIMNIKIGKFKIFENLLSGITQIGYWGNSEFIIIMVIASAFLAFIYKLSFGEYVESFIAGVKKMMPTAIYATLASVILTVLYQASYNGTGTIVNTMFNATMGSDFNAITTGFSALYGSFFYNDLYYLLSGLQPFISGFDANTLPIAGLTIQSLYSLGMLIFPTSVVLIAGLSYFDVSYKQWIKYIWKFALATLIIVLITCAVLTVL